MNQPLALRAEAESLAGPLPTLLAGAEHLANAVLLGEHGRKRAGVGDTFWQYRPAQHHDTARSIDWRRSARSDANFVQDKEWQIAQSIVLWVDQAAAMRFRSSLSEDSAQDFGAPDTHGMLPHGRAVFVSDFLGDIDAVEATLLRYLERLAERKDRLQHIARTAGWQFTTHHTDAPATDALLWLYSALERHS